MRRVRRYRRYLGSLGDEALPVVQPAVDSDILQRIDDRTMRIVDMIDKQDKARKWALLIGGASALFAAIKLGLIAFPRFRGGG